MYLLDSNIYINFYDRYYRMTFFPTFWMRLVNILNSKVVIPDIVVSETYQDENFSKWLKDNYKGDYLKHGEFAQSWSEVINYVDSCGYYKSEAIMSDRGWGNVRIADPWLIAIAKEKGYTIVTDEIKNPNLNLKNPSKSVKIPDVCHGMGVRCITMNQFFEKVGLLI